MVTIFFYELTKVRKIESGAGTIRIKEMKKYGFRWISFSTLL